MDGPLSVYIWTWNLKSMFILEGIESIWTSDSSDILGKFEGPPSMCSKVEVRNSLILCGPVQFKIKVDGSETKLAV